MYTKKDPRSSKCCKRVFLPAVVFCHYNDMKKHHTKVREEIHYIKQIIEE